MNWKQNRLFLSFLCPYWFKEVMLFALMIAGTVAGLASPYAMKIILDTDIPRKDFNGLVWIVCVLTLIYLLRTGLAYWSDYLTNWLGNKVVNEIKIKLFSNLLQFPYVYFEENSPGDIIQKVNLEIHKVQAFLTNSLIRFCNNIFTIGGLVAMLFLLDRELFLISTVVLPLSILINRSFNKKIKRLIEQSSKHEGKIYNFFIDRLKNIKLIKGFNGAPKEVESIRLMLSHLFGIYQNTSRYSSLSRNFSALFVALGPVVVLIYGGHQAIRGSMSIGALVAFIQYLNRFYAPANDMVYLYTDYVRVKVSMDRIYPILAAPAYKSGIPGLPSVEIKPGAPQQATLQIIEDINALSLDHIHFAYEGHSVLRGFSAMFSVGKRYALVGLSGSGKSTLIKLLSRFYTPEKGRILINNQIPVDQLGIAGWNQRITIIHQEPLLFMESLRFNLTYGNDRATDEEIWAALEDADCLSFVSQLPDSLDTRLGEGENGVLLSGGQQQQVSLARAFLRKTDVLVLDEATSAIDSYKEKKILQGLQQRFKAKIIISISHRLASIRNFDEIMVIHDGRLVEKGTHEQLVRLNGIYYKQFETQLGDRETSFCR